MDHALSFLKRKLVEIKGFDLQASVFKQLRSISIYLDWNNGSYGTAVYNRGTYGLDVSNQSPDKWKAVEILNTEIFLRSDTLNQPFLILHELAHGYRDRLGKFEQDMITNAFENAMRLGLYDRKVPNLRGEKVYPYARADEREYFAELTVAYLASNTTYPFNAEELEVHDPVGYGVVSFIWRYE